MRELTVIDTNILNYNDIRVMAAKACDGRAYISRSDTAKAIGITSAALTYYSKSHCEAGGQCLMPVVYQTSANKQEVLTSFIEYDALLALLTKRLSLKTHSKNSLKTKGYLDWLKTQDLFNDNKGNDIGKKHSRPASVTKETVVLSVVVFDKCVLKVAISR